MRITDPIELERLAALLPGPEWHTVRDHSNLAGEPCPYSGWETRRTDGPDNAAVCSEGCPEAISPVAIEARIADAARRIAVLTVADLTDELIEQAISGATEPCPKCGDLILSGCGRHLAKHEQVTR